MFMEVRLRTVGNMVAANVDIPGRTLCPTLNLILALVVEFAAGNGFISVAEQLSGKGHMIGRQINPPFATSGFGQLPRHQTLPSRDTYW